MNLFESIKSNNTVEKKHSYIEKFIKESEEPVVEETVETTEVLNESEGDFDIAEMLQKIQEYYNTYGMEKEFFNDLANKLDMSYEDLSAWYDSCKENMNESSFDKILGVQETLTEKVNQNNIAINKLIAEVLRSKTAARKYKDTLNKVGIQVDFSPREGVNLIGPNGRVLSADRFNVMGPAKPGHHETHDNGHYYSGKRYKSNIKNAKLDLEQAEKNLADLKALSHDDIIRKYPSKSTEEALAAHQKEIADLENPESFGSIGRKKRNLDYVNNEMRRFKEVRSRGHNTELRDRDITIPKEQANEKVDYKGYLDSKDKDTNKDLYNNGRGKPTKGEEKRQELSNLKHRVDNSVYYAGHARDIINNRKKDAKYVEEKRKELEDTYKKALERDIEKIKREKTIADDDYKKAAEEYSNNNQKLADFRKQMGLKARKAEAFDSYLEKRAQKPY